MRLTSLLLLLLSLLAVPGGTGQKASTDDCPVAINQISVSDAVLTQQRHLIRATAFDDGTDFLTPDTRAAKRALDGAVLFRPQAPGVIPAASHIILPPLRGPPVA
ncbi:hypothetical protein JQX09_21150 [Sulfitobacter pseudonitzschiae]|uniref:hypothetical protein n=1 Tax=Pseudosulfitobacter pseudonitzschiae TaxID=1402135 RepID=UPI001AF71B41|nr:hypothetical protein [Pseudosulfitobacter pseudonitzschiae]MBM2294436.1 hypothetical protein [Pseudosulfitobacter pseudonitzschiae]MBM2299404.1 hypothetical protein [Pseudosulfitobacter pseudonitzschiae]MBM2304268.1 hypothetical protein [Pseudosulfitobacter pseudonitzschiae]MBM2314048.1 hypothetical protein [Pseudosulfitobacter pseudonitzschiae]MBM2318963.1 hypothetical protein [Pseudosulfitobacter pseudonitzschiae]